MFIDQIVAGIAGARRLDQLDGLARDLWRAYAGGIIADDQTEALGAALETRRKALRGEVAPSPAWKLERLSPSIFSPRRVQRSPDRRRSIERRRHLAASGPMPPRLAAMFTTGELAVLRVVVDEVDENGLCGRSLAEIAARAGVCRTTAQNAVRSAAKLGLLSIEERRRPGRKNLPNLVRVLSREWLTWIRIGRGRRTEPNRVQKKCPHGQQVRKQGLEKGRGGDRATLRSTESIRERGIALDPLRQASSYEPSHRQVIGAGQTWA
jgi:hypothetical protein